MSEFFKGRHYNYATPRVEINGFNKAEDLCKVNKQKLIEIPEA